MSLLTRLFPRSTDNIVEQFIGTTKKLDAHADKQIAKAAKQSYAAIRLDADARSRIEDAKKAQSIKQKLEDLLS